MGFNIYAWTYTSDAAVPRAATQPTRRAEQSRGALYHQYRDKRDLFRAVFEAVEEDLGQRIARDVALETDPWAQLRAGACAFLAAATDPAITSPPATSPPSPSSRPRI